MPPMTKPFFILLLTFLAQTLEDDPQHPLCQKQIFKTQETKCTISFLTCPDTKQNKFLSCSINHCQRHLATQECKRSLDFSLEQQPCYRQCCKSSSFNQTECQASNIHLKNLRETQDSFIIFALVLLCGGLLIFTLIFFISVLKCNKEPENLKKQDKNQALVNWMESKYFDVKCDYCANYGAVILTPCRHAYHENCFFKELKNSEPIKCLKCPEKMFSTVRVFCGECREKHFKVKASKSSILKEIIAEGMLQHGSKCQKFSKEALTDVRLTSTGSTDS